MRNLRRRVSVALPLALLAAGGALCVAQSATAASCPDVEVVFARGSGEPAGLGILGGPLVRQITSGLSGSTVSSYAVNYAASVDQSSAGPGATDMTRHVVAAAKECSGTRFVLGGYSQGASVTDIALGIRTTLGRGEAVPAELAPRISAVVVFGNPLRLSRQSVDTASATYGDRALDLCATGDPVCGAGTNFAAHLSYATDGSVGRAAAFAVQKVRAGGSTTPAPPTDPTAPPTSTTAPTTPPSPTVPTTPPSPRTPRWPWVWIWG